MLLSQVVLSLQLPFAVIPLVHLTGSRRRMGAFANGLWVQIGAWSCAAFILVLNIWLMWNQVRDWAQQSGPYHPLVIGTSIVFGAGFLLLLSIITLWPWLRPEPVPEPLALERIALTVHGESVPVFPSRTYSRILVPLDHSEADQEALGNALALARMHGARLILLHVEEGVTSQMFGSLSSTAEIKEGQDYLRNVVASLREQQVEVEVVIRHGNSPARQITAAAHELRPDLIVMASHGHRGFKDLIFGTTINSVRHGIKVPLLIVSGS
jgi:manganese transport protein